MRRNRIWQSLYNDRIIQNIVPWAFFLGMLVSGWRVKDPFHAIPAYGDSLEVLWGIRWYAQQWFSFRSPAVYSLVFYPVGFYVATLAHTPFTFILLIPLYLIGGEAFAYNFAVFLSLFVAFGGMYRLARKLGSTWASATLAALLFTFWGFHWLSIAGHLNVLIGSSLLPWLVFALERAFTSRYTNRWFAAAGVIWAMAIMNLYYFAWIGGGIVAVWMFTRTWCVHKDWKQLIRGLLITGITALLLSTPILIAFMNARSAAGVTFHDINETLRWGVSVNSLPIPNVFHPYLSKVAQWIYRGPVNESGTASLGAVVFIVAVIGVVCTRHDRKWYPAYALVIVGLVLGMGLVIKRNDNVVQCGWCKPVNLVIWRIGHFLKPDFFTTEAPAPPLDQAFPLPGLILGVFVPFWEGARVFVRYLFIASIGLCLLVAQGIQRLKIPWLQALLVFLLLFELLPPPLGHVPAFPASHAAFEWIKQNTLPDDSLIDLVAMSADSAGIPIRGEFLWATFYHERATAAGVGSYMPPHVDFLYNWLVQHSPAFQNPEFISVLRLYQVDYVLLHLRDQNAHAVLELARTNPEFEVVNCFEPPATLSPWNYPICVLKVLPAENIEFDVLRVSGWSTAESWGVWAEGTTSHAVWMAVKQAETLLSIEAFPQCVPEKQQSVSIQVNEVTLATHQWEACEPWSTQIVIPADLVEPGMNDLAFEYAYAASPNDVTEGENPDLRQLSVGFTILQFTPSP